MKLITDETIRIKLNEKNKKQANEEDRLLK